MVVVMGVMLSALLAVAALVPPVPAANLGARRAALMEQVGEGVVVVRSQSQRPDDPPNSVYPQDSDYREDNDFYYLTGLEAPDSWLVLIARPNGPSEAFLYLPKRNLEEERWTGPQLGPGPEAARLTGIGEANVRLVDRLKSDLSGWLDGGGSTLYFKGDNRTPSSDVVRQLLAKKGPTRDLLPILAGLRQVKDDDEIGRLQRAVEISAQGHVAAIRAARPGLFEYELEAVAEYTFRRLGAERLAYPSIVGSGPNGATLHYDKNTRQIEAGELVVMDLGAEFGYYAADLTRTIPASGRFTDRQRRLYDLVLGAQQAALDSVRPGTTLGRLDRIARSYLKSHSDDLCGTESCEKFFIHGLSHYLGMDVHDVSVPQTPLAPGMVFTIEPGIYLPDERLGIRIEDDVLVTPSGYELLSKGLPRAAEEIERLMASKSSGS
jgi:Xaa-Pro aminopeptidase